MSALVSAIPILLLIVLMMGFKVSGYKSAIITFRIEKNIFHFDPDDFQGVCLHLP